MAAARWWTRPGRRRGTSPPCRPACARRWTSARWPRRTCRRRARWRRRASRSRPVRAPPAARRAAGTVADAGRRSGPAGGRRPGARRAAAGARRRRGAGRPGPAGRRPGARCRRGGRRRPGRGGGRTRPVMAITATRAGSDQTAGGHPPGAGVDGAVGRDRADHADDEHGHERAGQAWRRGRGGARPAPAPASGRP